MKKIFTALVICLLINEREFLPSSSCSGYPTLALKCLSSANTGKTINATFDDETISCLCSTPSAVHTSTSNNISTNSSHTHSTALLNSGINASASLAASEQNKIGLTAKKPNGNQQTFSTTAATALKPSGNKQTTSTTIVRPNGNGQTTSTTIVKSSENGQTTSKTIVRPNGNEQTTSTTIVRPNGNGQTTSTTVSTSVKSNQINVRPTTNFKGSLTVKALPPTPYKTTQTSKIIVRATTIKLGKPVIGVTVSSLNSSPKPKNS